MPHHLRDSRHGDSVLREPDRTLSIYGPDIIIYAADLHDYFFVEFADDLLGMTFKQEEKLRRSVERRIARCMTVTRRSRSGEICSRERRLRRRLGGVGTRAGRGTVRWSAREAVNARPQSGFIFLHSRAASRRAGPRGSGPSTAPPASRPARRPRSPKPRQPALRPRCRRPSDRSSSSTSSGRPRGLVRPMRACAWSRVAVVVCPSVPK